MLEDQIINKIKNEFNPTVLKIDNESHMHGGYQKTNADGTQERAESHFKLLVVSDQFSGINRVRRQQSVYKLLSLEMGIIHALSLRLLTVEEYGQSAADGFVSPNCMSKHTTT